jgi:small GTP-binding protein
LIADTLETKLATDYEAIRRREYELITSLLDVLPKIDTLSEDRVVQVRDALFHADHPFLMVFVGPFNAGKSSLINALLGKADLLPIGPVPTTDRISILRWGDEAQRMNSAGEVDTVFYPSPLLKKVSFVDTPGLESVFQKHEEITRKFLHRSDVVLLVMLATQVMTARNLQYMQMLKEYGKKIILVINQIDLLTPEEVNTVRDYVLEQSQDKLGFKPEVWLVSARQGTAARQSDPPDTTLWEASGLGKIEAYVDEQLSDVERLRQKLQTPLQITQNVSRVALEAVKANQAVLDQYQSIAENVEQQLAGFKREQDKTVRDIIGEVSDKFGAASMQGSEAIREIFQFSQALRSVGRGVAELPFLSVVFRRMKPQSYVRAAFDRHQAFEPIQELPAVVDKLGPRLEGRDIQDVDAMVQYARHEIDGLPPNIRSKVIGSVQAPMKYDRTALQEVRPPLEEIESEARELETDTLERTVRNAALYLAVWEILVIVLAIAVLNVWSPMVRDQPGLPNTLVMLVLLFALGLLGLAIMPLVGRVVETAHTNRLLKLQARYIEALSKAADKQVEYGMQLRRDAVSPLTRLVEAQTQIQREQLSKLQAAQQEMVQIEADLAKLGKKAFLGLRG